ncbi:hypothetical protein D9615_000300 [Tricholomella constricta]|uniref:Integrase catalytic domain-containing protein n=1 Tax=Tricholomella constricta TaxID=117010 RepID=A0A8H5HRB5_9AGAR|nr:hypothetical protein D9615_000300 [Tricholomella constricta]
MDTCGPFPIQTPHGKSFFHVILDDHSNYGSTALLAHKDEAVAHYLSTEASWERKSGNKVLVVRSDGAGEFTGGDLKAHFISRGIQHQVTAPYAHAQNGKAECYIRTLEETAQTLLAESGLPSSFFGDAVLTAQYLRNRLPSSTLPSGSTPFFVMENCKPDLSHLRVWGCQCFVLIPAKIRPKGGPKRFEAIFVGYEEGRIGWRVRDLNGKYHFSRDIVFNENVRGSLRHSTVIPTSPTVTCPTPPLDTSSASPPPTSSPPPVIPVPRRSTREPTLTTRGVDHATTIRERDERLARLRAARVSRSGVSGF